MMSKMFALPVIVAGLALAGCTHYGHHDRRSDDDRAQMQHSPTAPAPANMPGEAGHSAGPLYPNTGGSR